jgi:hypothetical protein
LSAIKLARDEIVGAGTFVEEEKIGHGTGSWEDD